MHEQGAAPEPFYDPRAFAGAFFRALNLTGENAQGIADTLQADLYTSTL